MSRKKEMTNEPNETSVTVLPGDRQEGSRSRDKGRNRRKESKQESQKEKEQKSKLARKRVLAPPYCPHCHFSGKQLPERGISAKCPNCSWDVVVK